ncbi:MAG: toll/interleukin-1 receptor domain-containing protein [Anaerolineae bacterium]|nr:toll/interleukin-1 receptor domain-containing protein [Anaerolineae bacterium]
MAHIFISYSSEDADFARYLQVLLTAQGFGVWLDQRRLEPGVDWWDEIEQGVTTSSAFIVIMSPESHDSKWVRREILLAEQHDKPIFPVLYRGEMWSRLAEIQFEDMRAGLNAQLEADLIRSLQKACGPVKSNGTVRFSIVQGDIAAQAADVVVFKYARGFHGADRYIASLLQKADAPVDTASLNNRGDVYFGVTKGALVSPYVMYMSMPNIFNLKYGEIRQFGEMILGKLTEAYPAAQHVAMTVHGPGIGLDISEAVLAQFGGLLDALQTGQYPPTLQSITIVEKHEVRHAQLLETMTPYLEESAIAQPGAGETGVYDLVLNAGASDGLQEAVASVADVKPYAVAIVPLGDAYSDIFYYGIQRPTHAYGLLCETFSIDSSQPLEIDALRQQIRQAQVVIADVGQFDHSIALGLGLAWGANRPVILVSDEGHLTPMFTDYQPLLTYSKIWHLEERLASVLKEVIG